ncbi:GNAT family N-acetyltransferase [Nocardioides acrostichi]|uniref:GNAT family N-acetyltransferase n=1 Tax=Nocardioides acrostichi TaxID=2784339 RepID=A0A930UYZ0_9ACTN|nr:GNAT family N-acetyltransferase [Nocardioides acrostichi]MBF4160831.1 GNAT family N-acetyltransferase [Nocardioides acrostichi]
MSELTIRTASADDVPELMALWEVAGENAARPDDRRELVEQLMARDPDAVIVAELGGTVVGSVIAGWDGWRANLYRLAVHPSARRRGVARRLLGEAERRLARLGAERGCAMVLEGNDEGAALWRAAGYAPQQEWRRWVRQLDA